MRFTVLIGEFHFLWISFSAGQTGGYLQTNCCIDLIIKISTAALKPYFSWFWFLKTISIEELPVSRLSLILAMLLHCAPWAWTVALKFKLQGKSWKVHLVFVVLQLSWYPSPATWARKVRLPSGLVQLNVAVLVPQLYSCDTIRGEQGAGKKEAEAAGVQQMKTQPHVFNFHTNTHTCSNVDAGAGCTVTQTSTCNDYGRVSLTAR